MNIKKFQTVLVLFLAVLSLSPFYSYAGVIVSGTRLVYVSAKKESSISIKNPDKKVPYLIQSWVDNAGPNDDQKELSKAPFIVTPPLFRLDPGSENTVRIVKLMDANKLPVDKESVFWLNIKSIPGKSDDSGASDSQNQLQFAIKTRIKLFFRPASLAMTPEEAAKKITFTNTNGGLIAHNPTAYYFTLYSLSADGVSSSQQSLNTMLPPGGEQTYQIKNNGKYKNVQWSYINDYGGISKILSSPIT